MPLPFPPRAVAEQPRQALTPASGVAVPLTSNPSDNNKAAVVVATIINRIAAGFNAFPLLRVGKVVSFCVFDGKPQAKLLLVFLIELDIKELIWHNKRLIAVAVKHIKRFKVSAIAPSCLGDVGWNCGVRDKVIHFAAYIDARFTTRIEDEKVILRRDLFVLKDVVARRKLLFIHWVVFIGGTPYANGMMSCGNSNFLTFLHLADVRHIEHTHFAARDVFKGLPQATIWLNTAVLVLPQFIAVNRNDVLWASKLLQRFRRCGDADHHDGWICGGFTYGVARNAGEVRLRAECGEDHDVMRLVADDDLKARGKSGIVSDPYTELGIGCYYDFFWRQFAPGNVASCGFQKENIRQCQRFVLYQAQVAVLGINKEKCFAGR